METIIPNEHPDNLSLEDIDKRLDLFLKYLEYLIDKKIKGIQQSNIGSFNQWLCYNRYSSLAI